MNALKPNQVVAVWNYNEVDVHIRIFHHMEKRGILEDAKDYHVCRNPLKKNAEDFDFWLFARPLSEMEPEAVL